MELVLKKIVNDFIEWSLIKLSYTVSERRTIGKKVELAFFYINNFTLKRKPKILLLEVIPF